MDIVFFGSDNFAVPSLKALLASAHKVSCVVTQPDRKKGRALQMEATPVKRLAEASSIKIYQPETVNAGEAVRFLKALNADLFIVIAYGQILSKEILSIPKIFAINVHASGLPKYRGAAPINWAIIKGEKNTGVTVIKMSEKLDAGPVILQETTEIGDEDTAITLEEKLSERAAHLLMGSLKAIGNKTYSLTEQDEGKVSFAPKLKKEDGFIDWKKSARDIHNLIRGCLGWPGAFTYYKDRLLKIYKARVDSAGSGSSGSSSGEIIKADKQGIVVATGEDNLIIEELQVEGKNRLGSREFIAGHKINVGEILGKN